MHLLSDAVTSIAVVVALIAVKLTGWRYIDPIAAMAVAVYLALLADSPAAAIRGRPDGCAGRRRRANAALLLDLCISPAGKSLIHL